jgi:hypothetical protein
MDGNIIGGINTIDFSKKKKKERKKEIDEVGIRTRESMILTL